MANELERGKRNIREYLSEVSDMSTLNNRRVFKIIVDEFENRMKDEDYFNEMSAFLNRRKPKKEKDEFCFNIIKDIVNSIDVKAIYASKYPDAFKVEENEEETEAEVETKTEIENDVKTDVEVENKEVSYEPGLYNLLCLKYKSLYPYDISLSEIYDEIIEEYNNFNLANAVVKNIEEVFKVEKY